jgi:hypothetical protein
MRSTSRLSSTNGTPRVVGEHAARGVGLAGAPQADQRDAAAPVAVRRIDGEEMRELACARA